jgi:hypothetical protein
MDAIHVLYPTTREKILDGDLLLFRRQKPSLVGRLITVAGRSIYSHVGMAAWWRGRLMCLDTLQFHGGRAVALSHLVDDAPGRIDVYRISRRHFDRVIAVQSMIEVTGRRYGWRSILRTSLVHLPVVRFFAQPSLDDRLNGSLPMCSQAVSRACRLAGVDLVPNLADAQTEPGDVARSAACRYLLTLIPKEEQEHAQ